MADLNRILTDNLAVVVAVLGVLLLLAIVLIGVQSLRLGRAVRAFRALVGDGAAGSLAEVLEAQTARGMSNASRLEELNSLHAELELRSRGSLQHVGMVRFNPFEDTGSDQSFAIALLDDRRNGLVISSLHGRTTTRVFAKPVEDGSSRHTLSDEESEAIRIALSGSGQPAESR
jgi:Protein of unknown function (DUF4446)